MRPSRHRFYRLPAGNGFTAWVAVDEEERDEVSLALVRGDFAFPLHYDLLLGGLQPGEVVLDLGAHIGTFSLAAAARGLQVVAVEASPRNVALLERSVEQQAMGDRVRVVWAAVSDRAGRLRFHQAGPYGHVVDAPVAGEVVEVKAVTVDQLVRDLGLGPVAAVKLDIEGSEPAAVRGMVGLLTGPAPPLLVYESNGHALHKFAATPADLVAALAALGYTSYACRSAGMYLARPEKPQWDCVVDHLATRRPLPRYDSLPLLDEPADEEALAELELFARHPHADYRAHVARTLQGWTAGPRAEGPAVPERSVRPEGWSQSAADRVARVCEALRNDADPSVRRAWTTAAPGEPAKRPTVRSLLGALRRRLFAGAALLA